MVTLALIANRARIRLLMQRAATKITRAQYVDLLEECLTSAEAVAVMVVFDRAAKERRSKTK